MAANGWQIYPPSPSPVENFVKRRKRQWDWDQTKPLLPQVTVRSYDNMIWQYRPWRHAVLRSAESLLESKTLLAPISILQSRAKSTTEESFNLETTWSKTLNFKRLHALLLRCTWKQSISGWNKSNLFLLNSFFWRKYWPQQFPEVGRKLQRETNWKSLFIFLPSSVLN